MKLDLATLQKRWKSRATLALTLESGRLVADVVRREESTRKVAQSFVLPLGADAIVAAPERAGEQLLAQLEAAGIRERRCVVCIPPGWALTASTDVPLMSADDLRGYLELRAEREFPASAADMRLAHCAYTLPDGQARATLAAVPSKRLEAVEKMLAAAGCRAVSISLGLDKFLPPPEQPPALHFLANGNHVDLVIAAGGGIVALRSLPGAASETSPAFDASGFSREVRITLGRLPDVLRQQVREAHFAGTARSAEALREQINGSLGRMGIESRAVESRSADGGSAGHPGTAIEAAEHHLLGEPVAFEFVAPQTNRWQTWAQRFDSRKRRLAMGAAIFFVVLPLLVFMVRSHMESRLEAEWKGMQKNVGELEALQLRIRQFRPWFEPLPQNLQILEGLTSAFPDQGDVWAKSVQIGEGGKVTCSGFARSQGAFMGMVDRLRSRPDIGGSLQIVQVRGENPVQFSLTYKSEPRNAK